MLHKKEERQPPLFVGNKWFLCCEILGDYLRVFNWDRSILALVNRKPTPDILMYVKGAASGDERFLQRRIKALAPQVRIDFGPQFRRKNVANRRKNSGAT